MALVVQVRIVEIFTLLIFQIGIIFLFPIRILFGRLVVFLRLLRLLLQLLLAALFGRFCHLVCGGQHQRKGPALQGGALLNDSNITQLFCELLKHFPPDVRMGHLPSTETQRKLYLVTCQQEAAGLFCFHVHIVGIGAWAQAHLFHLNLFLMLSRFPILFALFVAKLPVVHQAADGRGGVGRNLNKIQILLFGQFEGFVCGKDAELIPLRTNNPHLAGPNTIIQTIPIPRSRRFSRSIQ